MQTLADVIDTAKTTLRIPEDQDLAAHLGKSKAAVSAWRLGKTAPDDETCLTLAGIINARPALVLAIAAAARSRKSSKARDVWLSLTRELAALFFAIASLLTPGHGEASGISRTAQPGHRDVIPCRCHAMTLSPDLRGDRATSRRVSYQSVCYVHRTIATLARVARCIASICHPAFRPA